MKTLGPHGVAVFPSGKLRLGSGVAALSRFSMEQRLTLTGPVLGGCSTGPESHILLIEPCKVLL